GVVLIHRRQAQQRLHRVNHVDRGVEAMLDVGLRRSSWRILADDEGDRTMRIDVVGAILRVIFEDEDGSVIPVRAVRDGVDDTAKRQIIVGYVGGGTGAVGARASGMVVGKIEQYE